MIAAQVLVIISSIAISALIFIFYKNSETFSGRQKLVLACNLLMVQSVVITPLTMFSFHNLILLIISTLISFAISFWWRQTAVAFAALKE